MIDINELRLIAEEYRSVGQPMTIQASQMVELLDRLEETEKERDALCDALRSTAQTLAWVQHGECRGFSDDLLTTNEALEKARAALEEST